MRQSNALHHSELPDAGCRAWRRLSWRSWNGGTPCRQCGRAWRGVAASCGMRAPARLGSCCPCRLLLRGSTSWRWAENQVQLSVVREPQVCPAALAESGACMGLACELLPCGLPSTWGLVQW